MNEEISSHQNLAEIIDHAYDDSGTNLVKNRRRSGCHMYSFY